MSGSQIARELHDIVAHAMSVIAVRSGVARMMIDTEPEQAREALAIIETHDPPLAARDAAARSVLREATITKPSWHRPRAWTTSAC